MYKRYLDLGETDQSQRRHALHFDGHGRTQFLQLRSEHWHEDIHAFGHFELVFCVQQFERNWWKHDWVAFACSVACQVFVKISQRRRSWFKKY